MDYKRLRASQVRLDPQNPRLPDGTSSDHEAVNRLLEENYSALLGLARDLVEQGESNPAELPIVMKDGSKYLVLEGNRRFAALKLLASPTLADDEKQRTAFARLARKGTPPKTVMCAVDTGLRWQLRSRSAVFSLRFERTANEVYVVLVDLAGTNSPGGRSAGPCAGERSRLLYRATL